MTGKIRRTKLIARGSQPLINRDPNIALIFVSSEDTYAAAQYLEALQAGGLVDRNRVEIIVLPTTDGRASLAALTDRLDQRWRALDVRLPEDEYWAVFDVDHHEPKELSQATQVARQRGHWLAGSNPCFELWLLLHLTDDIAELLAAGGRGAPTLCEKLLRSALQSSDPRGRGYNKTRVEAERFAVRERVDAACARARALSPPPLGPWPSAVGTHVHLLVERLPRPPAALAG